MKGPSSRCELEVPEVRGPYSPQAVGLASGACGRFDWDLASVGASKGCLQRGSRPRIAGDSISPLISRAKSREFRFPANRSCPRRSGID